MTIKEVISVAKDRLKNTQRATFEAELLLAFHLKKDRVYLHAFGDEEVQNIQGYWDLIDRRAKNEPYEYITNRVSFYDIELYVDRGVLIPRPETEILIDNVSKLIEEYNISRVAEIGVGSGAISIVLARKFPHIQIISTDISPETIDIAQKNILSFCLEEQITLIQSNLLDDIDMDIDLVVSNPPYISNNFELDSNIIDYEPKEALFGGEVGDELLKEIILDTKRRGVKFLACEMGYDQKESLNSFFISNGIFNYYFYKDLAGLDRGFVISNLD